MKTFLLIALAFTGIALCAPEAQARDHKHHSRSRDSYYSGYSSYGHHYDRGCESRGYDTYAYYRPAPRYYHRRSRSYYSSERCYSDRRHSFRPPLISFLFGF